MTHTKEPWVIHAQYRAIVPVDDIFKHIPLVGTENREGNAAHTIALFRDPDDAMPEDETRSNAARIVSCVNALAGLNPDAVADVVAALEEASKLLDRAADWIDKDPGARGPAEDAAHTRIINALDSGLDKNRTALARIRGEG